MVSVIHFVKENYKQLLIFVLILVLWGIYGSDSYQKRTFFYSHHIFLFSILPLHVTIMFIASLVKGGSNKTKAFRNVIIGIIFPIHIWFMITLNLLLSFITNSSILYDFLDPLCDFLIVFTYSLSGLLFILYRDKIVIKSWFP
jgi:hypothetical protein